MSLFFDLMATVTRTHATRVGSMEIQRQQHLDLSNKTAIADAVCTYTVSVEGRDVGEVEHRYGDGAWRLLAKAADLAAEAS